ncbi:MAG: STAS/SEC14 domain-containing protein [Chloroflexota bacterium]
MTDPTTEPTTNSIPAPIPDPIPDPIESKCAHIAHANGMHEFMLKEFGMSGADAFITQIERLYKGHTSKNPPLLLIMNSPGSLPISYSLQRGKEMMAKYPDLGVLRVAVLSDSLFETHLVDSFMRLMRFPTVKMRFFDAAKRAEAEQWLFGGK